MGERSGEARAGDPQCGGRQELQSLLESRILRCSPHSPRMAAGKKVNPLLLNFIPYLVNADESDDSSLSPHATG